MMLKHEIIALLPLTTERLLIRQPTFHDVDAVQDAKEGRADDLRRWMSWSSAEGMSRQSVYTYLNNSIHPDNRRGIPLIAVSRLTADFVMATGLDAEDDNFLVVNTGYWIAKNYEGQGLAFEAMSTLLAFAFGAAQIERIQMDYYHGNDRSQALMERLGLRLDHITPHGNTSHLDGTQRDVYHCCLNRQDYTL